VATKVRNIPPARPAIKRLPRTSSSTTLTKLVRDNVITLTREYMARDKASNLELTAFEEWKKKGSKPASRYTQTQIDELESRERFDPKEWTQSRLAKTLGIRTAVVKRIYAKSGPKATKSLSMDDVVTIAIALHVSPSFLLQPNRKQLDENSTLMISGLRTTPFEVSAHTWFLWVHGIAGLDATTNLWYIRRMAEITTLSDAKYDEPSNIIPIHEINRIISDSYTSAFASGVSLLRKFEPEKMKIDKPTYLGGAKRMMQPADRDLRMFQALNDAMTSFRLAVTHMFQHSSETDTEKAIRWSLNNMGNAFAQLAKNRNKPLE